MSFVGPVVGAVEMVGAPVASVDGAVLGSEVGELASGVLAAAVDEDCRSSTDTSPDELHAVPTNRHTAIVAKRCNGTTSSWQIPATQRQRPKFGVIPNAKNRNCKLTDTNVKVSKC